MLNLSLNELKVIVKITGTKGYKSMSKDRLLSALIASKSTRGKDRNVDKGNTNKIIREIRKENRDEDEILIDLDFAFAPEKDHYEPKKTVNLFNNNYIFNMKVLEIKTKH